MGLGVHGLVYGVILGAFLHLAIQIPGLIKYKFKWIPQIGLNDPGVKQVLGLLGPRVATMLFVKMFLVVRDNLASHLNEGSLSAINLGWFIMQVPETLLGTAVAITLLPTISELLARGEKDKFSETINQAARAMLAMTIPVAILLAVGLRPLVQFAFSFSAEGTGLVVLATRAYLLGLVGHALLEIAARSFYAQQDAKTPLLAAAINAFLYLALAVTLSNQLGFVGIALANSIAFTTEALLLLYILNRRFPGILAVRKTLTRALLVSAAAGGILYFVLNLPPIANLSLIPSVAVYAGGMLAALLGVTPFVWSEVKLLVKIGG
jgi:putative peptidoglycan lipid II flippase